MIPVVKSLGIRWAGVEGVTGYEIKVNDKVVSTTGAKARTTRVVVDGPTKIEIIDLPERSLVQTLDFSQEDSA